jgi:hypothetical protein
MYIFFIYINVYIYIYILLFFYKFLKRLNRKYKNDDIFFSNILIFILTEKIN